MDWIDPRHNISIQEENRKSGAKRKGKRISADRRIKPLANQVSAAMSQPLAVWASAYDHSLSRLKWPNGVSIENSFLFSCVMQEQAEILVRSGMSAKKLAAIVSESTGDTEEAKAARMAEVVGLMEQSLESIAFGWLETADAYAKSALGITALAWHVPEHAHRPGNEWLTQWLQAVVDRIATYAPDLDESVVCHLALQCELPLLIGLATSASQRTVLSEATKAMDNLAEYLERSEDAPAPWLAHGVTYLRAALASVVRCRVLANTLGLRKWFPPQQSALANLLKHAARWARPDGTQLLAAGNSSPRSRAIWEALVKQTKNPKSLRSVMVSSGLAGAQVGNGREHITKLPALTFYCDDAAGVCMQGDWRKKGSRFALDFSDSEICIEALGPKGKPLLAGEWTASVELDQQSQLQLDEWGEVCWFSDDDVDYLELEAKFGQHARVQRQVLFFREDRLLLLADAMLCDQLGAWSLSSRLPLAGDVQFEAAKKTTEGFIVSPSGGRSLVLPLHLPEWRRQPTLGSLTAEGELLVAQNHVQGQRLYTATLISLCNSHAKKPFTWRRLTVGEDLKIVGAEEAVAYRVQIGTDQWLLYRSLAQTKRRTALGMHTLSEFFVGRFDGSDGEVETLLTVEASS